MKFVDKVFTFFEGTASQLEAAAAEDGAITIKDASYLIPVVVKVPELVQSFPSAINEIVAHVKQSRLYVLIMRYVEIGKKVRLKGKK